MYFWQAHTVLEMNYTEQQLTAAITSGLRPVLAGGECSIPSSLSSLIERCWNNDPTLRPSFTEIVKELNEICSDQNTESKRDIKRMGNGPKEISLDLSTHVDSAVAIWPKQVGSNREEATLVLGPSWLKSLNVMSTYTPTLSSGFFAARGGRDTMEDTCFLLPQLGGASHVSLFGVFDGHRGNIVI